MEKVQTFASFAPCPCSHIFLCCVFLGLLHHVYNYLNICIMISRVKCPSGLLPVYKPKGITSNDAVGKIKSLLNEYFSDNEIAGARGKRNRIKVGHGGTLDPLATGVLVLGIGDGTKLLENYLKGSKRYLAVGKLGIETDSLDCLGKILSNVSCDGITIHDIERVAKQFSGEIMQTPPMFSALKSNGRRLYTLAREGIVIPRKSRPVTVYDLHIIGNPSYCLPEFGVDVECSGGFYVRKQCQVMYIDYSSTLYVSTLLCDVTCIYARLTWVCMLSNIGMALPPS